MSDFFGRKWTFITGLAGFAVASAVGGAAQSFGMLVAARAVQGAFGALLAPAALSLLTTTFTLPASARRRSESTARSPARGRVGRPAARRRADQRARLALHDVREPVFAVVAIAGGVALLAQPAPGDAPAARPRRTVLASGGLFSIVYGFDHAQTGGAAGGTRQTVAFLVAAVACCRGVRRVERRVAQPAAAAPRRHRPQSRRPRSSRSASPRPACSACSCS